MIYKSQTFAFRIEAVYWISIDSKDPKIVNVSLRGTERHFPVAHFSKEDAMKFYNDIVDNMQK